MRGRRPTILASVLAVGLALPAALAWGDTDSESFVVERAYAAVSAGDLDAAVDMLTDDAVFAVVPASSRMDGPALVGKDAIRAWWTGTHKDKGWVEVENLMIDGDRASFTCLYHGTKLEKLGISPAVFDGVAILREGKIRVLVWSYTAAYEPRLREALSKIKP